MKNKKKKIDIKFTKNEICLIACNLALVLLILGVAMNIIAVKTNDMKMPVLSTRYWTTEYHSSFIDKAEINNYHLVDIFKFDKYKFSIGDVYMIIGISAFTLVGIMLIKNKICEARG